MVQTGFFVISDISGYTAFLTQTELEHAREILDNLLTTLLNEVRPPLTVVKIEGDGLFAYSPQGSVIQGQTFLESIENVYHAFCLARDNIHRSCGCGACTRTADLDLKIVVHHGGYSVQQVGPIPDLQGKEVVTVHRLLKNHIIEQTGVKAYAFFTQDSIDALDLNETAASMIPHWETYEHVGEVSGYVHDLAAARARDADRHRVVVPPDGVWLHYEIDLDAPPARAWDYLHAPHCMCEWCGMDSVTVSKKSRGRFGVGSALTCVHAQNKGVVVEVVLDYQPFNYATFESRLPNGMRVRTTTEVLSRDNAQGSRVLWRVGRPVGKDVLQTAMLRAAGPLFKLEMANELKENATRLKAMADREEAAADAPEPVLTAP